MMKRIVVAAGFLLAVSASAQNVERAFRASMLGARGEAGRCLIEVDVDGVAVMEITRDSGRLLTLAGQPAEWRRLECNQPLPPEPLDFRFRGIDGRGRVTLAGDPRQNRGVAAVRIEDSKGGRDLYRFELTWREPAFDRQVGVRPANPDPVREPERRDYRERRWETEVISCASDGRRRFCEADTSRGALLLRPQGEAECRLNVSWGFDERGIWVDRGCRADFQVGRRY